MTDEPKPVSYQTPDGYRWTEWEVAISVPGRFVHDETISYYLCLIDFVVEEELDIRMANK